MQGFLANSNVAPYPARSNWWKGAATTPSTLFYIFRTNLWQRLANFLTWAATPGAATSWVQCLHHIRIGNFTKFLCFHQVWAHKFNGPGKCWKCGVQITKKSHRNYMSLNVIERNLNVIWLSIEHNRTLLRFTQIFCIFSMVCEYFNVEIVDIYVQLKRYVFWTLDRGKRPSGSPRWRAFCFFQQQRFLWIKEIIYI